MHVINDSTTVYKYNPGEVNKPSLLIHHNSQILIVTLFLGCDVIPLTSISDSFLNNTFHVNSDKMLLSNNHIWDIDDNIKHLSIMASRICRLVDINFNNIY